MRATIPGALLALVVAVTIACDGGTTTSAPPHTVTPGEAAGTTGSTDEPIAISGCVTHVPPDGYMLASLDDAVDRMKTAGRHEDNPATRPTDPNRGAENERARHDQNVSAEMTRYRLAGDPNRLAAYVDREVDVSGRLMHDDRENATPMTIAVESVKPTGAACGGQQKRGNERK